MTTLTPSQFEEFTRLGYTKPPIQQPSPPMQPLQQPPQIQLTRFQKMQRYLAMIKQRRQSSLRYVRQPQTRPLRRGISLMGSDREKQQRIREQQQKEYYQQMQQQRLIQQQQQQIPRRQTTRNTTSPPVKSTLLKAVPMTRDGAVIGFGKPDILPMRQ